MIVLLGFADGRDEYALPSLASATEHLHGQITRRVMVHDGPEPSAAILDATPGWEHLIHHERLGFGGTIRRAWEHLADSAEEFVAHWETDFTLNRDVDLDAMAAVLDYRPNLVQLALRRQPWNDDERAAGGIVEMWPDEYEEHSMSRHVPAQFVYWLEHRLYVTTNPSLYRRSLCARGWPEGERSEETFSRAVFADPDARAGFWGARDSGEACHHIGEHRAGGGY